MLQNVYEWLSTCWGAILHWFEQLGEPFGIGSLATCILVFTIISIILSYTIRPAVGKSDESAREILSETTEINGVRRTVSYTRRLNPRKVRRGFKK